MDFYREASDTVCRPCPLNSGTPGAASSHSTACICKPGFMPESSNCVACPAGTFKPALAMLACSSCPADSTSAPSSSAQADCVCKAGFYENYMLDTLLCSVCTAGCWCPGQGAKQDDDDAFYLSRARLTVPLLLVQCQGKTVCVRAQSIRRPIPPALDVL